MRHRPFLRDLRHAALLVAALVVAMAGAGVGRVTAPAAPDPALVAFLAAGGSLDDLCLDGGHGPGGERGHCEACLLGALAAPAAPAHGLGRASAPLPMARGRLGALVIRGRRFRSARRPRAPPLVWT